MNSIYRNFIITLKVNKMAATLNICGLVIAFTLFDSVAIRTESERTFDKIHSKAEAIYRLDCVTSKSQWPTQICLLPKRSPRLLHIYWKVRS